MPDDKSMPLPGQPPKIWLERDGKAGASYCAFQEQPSDGVHSNGRGAQDGRADSFAKAARSGNHADDEQFGRTMTSHIRTPEPLSSMSVLQNL